MCDMSRVLWKGVAGWAHLSQWLQSKKREWVSEWVRDAECGFVLLCPVTCLTITEATLDSADRSHFAMSNCLSGSWGLPLLAHPSIDSRTLGAFTLSSKGNSNVSVWCSYTLCLAGLLFPGKSGLKGQSSSSAASASSSSSSSSSCLPLLLLSLLNQPWRLTLSIWTTSVGSSLQIWPWNKKSRMRVGERPLSQFSLRVLRVVVTTVLFLYFVCVQETG